MLGAFTRLAHRLQAVVQLGQQVAHRALAHPMPARPSSAASLVVLLHVQRRRRHRIAPAGGFDQGIKVGKQARVDVHQTLASAAGRAHALVRISSHHRLHRGLAPLVLGFASSLDLGQTGIDGCARQPSNFGHHADATATEAARLGSGPQSQCRLVKTRRQGFELGFDCGRLIHLRIVVARCDVFKLLLLGSLAAVPGRDEHDDEARPVRRSGRTSCPRWLPDCSGGRTEASATRRSAHAGDLDLVACTGEASGCIAGMRAVKRGDVLQFGEAETPRTERTVATCSPATISPPSAADP